MLHEFEAEKRAWRRERCEVRVSPDPFARGTLRAAHRAALRRRPSGVEEDAVVKFALDARTPASAHFADAERQTRCAAWARRFNESGAPRRVRFLPARVVELADRPGRPSCGCEPFVAGRFVKLNNNVGAAAAGSDLESDTAQAFSHFTWERSGHTTLICDIQGFAGGVYTDPQVHTVGGGSDDHFSRTGVRAFLARHRCNDICRMLGLEADKGRRPRRQEAATSKEVPAGNSRANASLAINELDERLMASILNKTT